MQKLSFENKRANLMIGDKTIGREELMKVKQDLLYKIGRESDPAEREELEYKLTEINSGLKAIDNAELAVSETKLEVTIARFDADQAERAAASAGQKQFESNCLLIATKNLERKVPTRHQGPLSDGEGYFVKTQSDHYRQLHEALSYEAAEAQSDEILDAARDRREWRELTKLPHPAAVEEFI